MIIEILEAIVEASNSLAGWAIAAIMGSVAMIVGAGYLKPHAHKFRWLYLLFLPGWASLGYSAYLGQVIQRHYIAALLSDADLGRGDLIEIHKSINHEYMKQLDWFSYGLGFFSLWLVLFLLWWIILEGREKKDESQ